MRFSLNGEWQFRAVGEVSEWLWGKVPGCNYTDLLAAGVIDDPFYGVNEKNAYEISKKDWIYKRAFTFDESPDNFAEVTLTAEVLDTAASIYLNGEHIGSAANYHIEHSYDIKTTLKKGENEIEIVFRSPVKLVEQIYKDKGAPKNNNGQNGIVHIRKPQCHFGWDWGPVLPPSGISGHIYIECVERAKIEDLELEQTHADGKVTLDVKAPIENYGRADNLKYRAQLIHPDGKIEVREGVAADCVKFGFIVENPELWWTKELSGKKSQPLYEIKLALICNGETIDAKTKKTGLRTIELNRSRDRYGENFRFILNGVPLFIKGANLIPPDSFITRFDRKKWDKLLDAALFANLNMIRVWGGGNYGSDYFYDRCDELGILVWQDFMFACQAYPFFERPFLENVKKEVFYNVRRLKHHASLALWAGNNEIEAMAINWFWKTNYVKWTRKFFYEILPKWVREVDRETSYIPGTPCGDENGRGIDRDNVGDTHLWAVWHGLQPLDYYRKRNTRFCSEFGFESVPDLKTVRTFAEDKDLKMNSEVMRSHQKCASGNDKMIYYIASEYRLPKEFDGYVYLSQMCQEKCVRDATAYWRRNRGRCNGSMYWQFNDCWPTCSWAGLDYEFGYKALQYFARRFNAPVAVGAEEGKDKVEFYAVNDYPRDISVEMEFKASDFDGKVLSSSKKVVTLKALSGVKVMDFDFSELKESGVIRRAFACVILRENGEEISRAVTLLVKPKEAELKSCVIKTDVSIADGVAQIELSSDKFAKGVRLIGADNEPFSDNYFDLLPDEVKIITQKTCAKSAEQFRSGLEIISAADIKPAGSRAHDWFERARVFLQPVNFFSALYMRRVPPDIKFKT